jgi:hypothetical protein
MARPVTFQNAVAGANTVAYTVEDDGFILNVQSTADISLSRDPNVTHANISTPTVSGTILDPISVIRAQTKAATGAMTRVPVLRGEVIYCAFSGVGSAIVYFEQQR